MNFKPVVRCAVAADATDIGTVGAAIPTYITVWDEVTPEQAAAHHAFKLHVESADDVAALVKRTREAVGLDREVMIDAWMRWDIETTLDVAAQLEGLDVGWIEEPLPAEIPSVRVTIHVEPDGEAKLPLGTVAVPFA